MQSSYSFKDSNLGMAALGFHARTFHYATETPNNNIKQSLYISQAHSLEYIQTCAIPKIRTIKKPEKEYEL